jgi:hypothetical protein
MRREDGRRPRPPLARYPSIASFYRADPRRRPSRELDVGLWWREDAGDALHRAAWVADTGELYLVRLGPSEAGGGHVEVLASVVGRERLENALAGWRERCGQPGSLSWLRERTARLEALARAPRFSPAAKAGRAGAVPAAPAVALGRV